VWGVRVTSERVAVFKCGDKSWLGQVNESQKLVPEDSRFSRAYSAEVDENGERIQFSKKIHIELTFSTVKDGLVRTRTVQS
jgi:hypothetical protein